MKNALSFLFGAMTLLVPIHYQDMKEARGTYSVALLNLFHSLLMYVFHRVPKGLKVTCKVNELQSCAHP